MLRTSNTHFRNFAQYLNEMIDPVLFRTRFDAMTSQERELSEHAWNAAIHEAMNVCKAYAELSAIGDDIVPIAIERQIVRLKS